MSIFFTLLILWVGHFLVDFMIAVFPVYKTMAGMDLAAAGVVASICALLGEGGQLFFGAWSDRGYRKRLIGAGVLATCAVLGIVYLESVWLMFPCILATYLGSAAFHPAAAGLVGSLSQQYKGVFISIFASGGAFGLAAGQIAFFRAYESLGRGVIVLMIPSLILVLVLAFFALPRGAAPPKKPLSLNAMLQLFGQCDLRFLYIALVCNTTVFFGFMFLLPDLLVARSHPEWVCYGCGHLAMVLGGACMMVPSGYLADRYSARSVILMSMLAGLGLFYMFLLVPPMGEAAVLCVLFAIGALLGVVHPVGVALANRFLPAHPGLVSAFAMGMVWALAECFGPASSLLTRLFPPAEATLDALLVLGTLNLFGSMAAWALPTRAEQEIALELT